MNDHHVAKVTINDNLITTTKLGLPPKTKYHTLFIVTSPSGSGKTTVMRNVLDNEITSFTTRPMRDGEVDGVDYNFISKEKFEELNSSGGLVETTEYDGQHYGITIEEFETKVTKGDCFVVVDINGFKQITKMYPFCVTIFIHSYDYECQSNMLDQGRKLKLVKSRLKTYSEEIKNRHYFDYVIRNERGKMDKTIKIVKAIVEAESR